MTTKEFSNLFDILLNSYMSLNSFGDAANNTTIVLDEYEKSVYLTLAQEAIVLMYYNGQGTLEGFDNTELVRRSLSSLIKESMAQSTLELSKLFSGESIWNLPNDLWFIICESITINNKNIPVIPITYDEYHKIIKNPFRGVSNNRALKLDYGKDGSTDKVMILTKQPIDINEDCYYISYISKPSPIILEDLTSSGLSINGIYTKLECQLHSSLHYLILNKAVQLAIATHTNNN